MSVDDDNQIMKARIKFVRVPKWLCFKNEKMIKFWTIKLQTFLNTMTIKNLKMKKKLSEFITRTTREPGFACLLGVRSNKCSQENTLLK